MNVTTPFSHSEQDASPSALSSLVRGNALPPDMKPTALRNYWRLVVHRRWLIIGAIAVALLLGLLATLLATPLYTAVTRIEISRSSDRIVEVEDVEQESEIGDPEFYQPQYGLLESRSLAQRIVRDLRLHEDREFFETFEAMPEDPNAFAPSQREARIRSATAILLSNVSISPIRGSRLVDIGFTSPLPALSARIANSWAENFIESNLERRFESTAYARNFLEERLAQLRGRLEQSERDAVGYAAREGLISVEAPSADGTESSPPRSLVSDNLARLNAELSAATAARVQAESRLGREAGGASVESLASPAIASLRQRRAEIAAE